MSQAARVSSLDALKDFRESLCGFRVDAQGGLAAADQEVQRFLDWLQGQLQYWLHQVRERQEEVTRAKTALVQRRWGHNEGRGPGTTEQELALRKAQVRLQEAEEKVVTVRRWLQQLPRAIQEFEGPTRQLAGWLDADLRHGIAILDQKIETLEAYAALTTAAPAAGGAQQATAPASEPNLPPAAGAAPEERTPS